MDEMTREPCDFVKLVLQRMDSNPEEFEHYGRWSTLCTALERYAEAYPGDTPVPDRNVLWAYDQFEVDLMVAKYRTIYRGREYKNMLKSILMGNEPKQGERGRTIPGAGTNDINAVYKNITPQQLYADTTTTTANPQLRAMMDDAIESKMMQRLNRG